MWRRTYLEPTELLIQSAHNRSFNEIRHLSKAQFRNWAIPLRELVAKVWAEEGAPPFFRSTTEEIVSELHSLGRRSSTASLEIDELTGRRECLVGSSIGAGTCRAFFPNIDMVGDANEGVSLYDYFTKPECLEPFIDKLWRQLARDGLYLFAQPLTAASIRPEIFERTPPVKLDLPGPFQIHGHYTLDDLEHTIVGVEGPGLEWDSTRAYALGRLVDVSSGSDCVELLCKWRRERDLEFWLELAPEISATEEFTVTKRELLKLRAREILPRSYLREIEGFGEAKLGERFRIRAGYFKQEKIFPKGFRAFKRGLVLGATIFPATIAKYLFCGFTNDIKDQDEIVIYDSCAGFGGDLLGALAAGWDRQLRYVATDPNPDNWITASGVPRYEGIAGFYHRNVLQPFQTRCDFFSSGSEVIHKNERFSKYRGKIDLFFTSPPYFRAESYSDDPNQSDKKFPDYESWREGFMRPTLRTAVEWLRPGRPLLLNIADSKDGSTYVPLEADSMAILRGLGMQHETTLKYVLGGYTPGTTNRSDGQFPAAKNFCMVNGRYRKYEPIFVFRKPR